MDMMCEARGAADLLYAIGFKRMSNEGIIFLLAVFSACSAWADGFTVKCGAGTMVANPGASYRQSTVKKLPLKKSPNWVPMV